MPAASPVKWHLAHTTWFFEEFVLGPFEQGFTPVHPTFRFLFNSYYEGVGPRHERAERGLLTRPTLREVWGYRTEVEERVQRLLEFGDPRVRERVDLGCHHEQQHQELLLTDLKHLFSRNPLNPVYRPQPLTERRTAVPLALLRFEGGLVDTGARADQFAFDNERPRHRVYLEGFRLANRLVTNSEFEDFVRDGGYSTPGLWLDEGWALVRAEHWSQPLYWRGGPGEFREFTLAGERELVPEEPVCHVSFYEADAYARWHGSRLPREHEWERVVESLPVTGNLLGSEHFHPKPATGPAFAQYFGDAWEWTASAYLPYPGFRPLPGALGEYNGKFMANQMVLRGGSCFTAPDHVRSSYRNFFHPSARWQCSGIRLATDDD